MKRLKNNFKCCICQDVAGFVPNWESYKPGDLDDKNNIKRPLICKGCDAAFLRLKSKDASSILEILAWVSKRAREAEHRRMADKVNDLNYKLQQIRRSST